MESMSNAERWGLPEGFVPVRFDIADEIKMLLRPLLGAGEPAVVTLSNAEGAVTLIGTPQRLFVVRSGEGSAGATGISTREFPWLGVTRLTLAQTGQNVKLAIGFRTSNGRTAEVGRRAAMGRDAIENALGFDSAVGNEAFGALHQIWQHVRHSASEPQS